MAIIDNEPGIKVTVRVRGKDCAEYDDPDSWNRQVSSPTTFKYIEAIDNSEFGIQFEIGPGYIWGYKNHSLAFYVWIDGQYFSGSVVKQDRLTNGYYAATVRDQDVFTETGLWITRKPKFSAVKIVDDNTKDRLQREQNLAKDLGTISVKVYRATEHGYSFQRANSGPLPTSSYELAESSLKGKEISHGTSFSTGRPADNPRHINTVPLPEDNGPIATFEFMYKSRESLKREYIIPRSPFQSPTTGNRFYKLPRANIQRLDMERSQELETKVEVKDEKSRIKSEFGEAIDLTQDDAQVRRTKKPATFIDLTDD